MPPLNDGLNWSGTGGIGAIVTSRPGDVPVTTVADAFKTDTGEPTKDLLPAGMLLYKFAGGATWRWQQPNPPPADFVISPWWSPVVPYKNDGGLVERMKLAALLGVSFREWGRLTSVIMEDWSDLSWVLQIELAQPVTGWFGRFKGMKRVGNAAEGKRDAAVEKAGKGGNLPGGGTQLYIPNMTYRGYVKSEQWKNI